MTLTQTALQSLRRNLMRSILTTLGIIIGISAVIIMFALGEGAQRQVDQQIQNLGSNLLMVRTGTINSAGAQGAAGQRTRLDMGDVYAIKASIPEVTAIAATSNGQAQIIWGNQNWNTRIEGANADILIANNWRLLDGRGFTES